MVIGLLRGMRRSDSQYLAGTIREAKFTSLGYETRLSSPHPPHYRWPFQEATIRKHATPSRKITKVPKVGHMYLKQARLH
jgi:hypothetical protein